MFYHCMAEINETATFIAGGALNSEMSNKTFIYNWVTGQFSNAADMDKER